LQQLQRLRSVRRAHGGMTQDFEFLLEHIEIEGFVVNYQDSGLIHRSSSPPAVAGMRTLFSSGRRFALRRVIAVIIHSRVQKYDQSPTLTCSVLRSIAISVQAKSPLRAAWVRMLRVKGGDLT
jgi:hypothetical protein